MAKVYQFPYDPVRVAARQVVAKHAVTRKAKENTLSILLDEVNRLVRKVDALSLQVNNLQRR